MLERPLPFLNDPEGDRVPDGLRFIVDGHVHLFPDSIMRSDRIIFGTDFPNLPYAWDREIKNLASLNLSDDTLARVLGQNACDFYRIDLPDTPA